MKTKKPTAEEWEQAWDLMRHYCMRHWHQIEDGIDPYDPRNKSDLTPEEPEMMDFLSIIGRAKTEERFNENRRLVLGKEDLVVTSVGSVVEADSRRPYKAWIGHIKSKTWHFTKCHSRCPKCGQLLEDK